jgi:hypothetical protein
MVTSCYIQHRTNGMHHEIIVTNSIQCGNQFLYQWPELIDLYSWVSAGISSDNMGWGNQTNLHLSKRITLYHMRNWSDRRLIFPLCHSDSLCVSQEFWNTTWSCIMTWNQFRVFCTNNYLNLENNDQKILHFTPKVYTLSCHRLSYDVLNA